MTTTEPTHDWAEDFDIFDPHQIRDPYPIWGELRGGCPVAHTDAVGRLVLADDPRRRRRWSPTTSLGSPRPRSPSHRSRRPMTLRATAPVDHRDRPARSHTGAPAAAAVLRPEGGRAVPGADVRAAPPPAARLRRARRGRRRGGVRQADPAARDRRDPRDRSLMRQRFRRVGPGRPRARAERPRCPREVPGDHRAVLPRGDRAAPDRPRRRPDLLPNQRRAGRSSRCRCTSCAATCR